MHEYTVEFTYVDSNGKTRHDSFTIQASGSEMAEAIFWDAFRQTHPDCDENKVQIAV